MVETIFHHEWTHRTQSLRHGSGVRDSSCGGTPSHHFLSRNGNFPKINQPIFFQKINQPIFFQKINQPQFFWGSSIYGKPFTMGHLSHPRFRKISSRRRLRGTMWTLAPSHGCPSQPENSRSFNGLVWENLQRSIGFFNHHI